MSIPTALVGSLESMLELLPKNFMSKFIDGKSISWRVASAVAKTLDFNGSHP